MIIFILIVVILIACWIGYKYDSKQFIPLALTAVIAICGWFVVHQLSVSRDRLNKHRDIRIHYLTSAYQRLANASMRPPSKNFPYFKDMESAIADIQLFGTEKQIEIANAFMEEFQKTNKGSLDSLLNDLRNDLRNELELTKLKDNVRWFRPEGTPEINK